MKETAQQLTEQEWWNRYSGIMEQIWNYDAYLDARVRGAYLAEMREMLFKEKGRVLDFGCGSAWTSASLAQRGMRVVGIDLSIAQLCAAQARYRALGITNANFICSDQIPQEPRGYYDSVLTHALWHHLSAAQKEHLLHQIAAVLREGGKLYLYEPLAPRRGRAPLGLRVLEKIIGVFMGGLDTLARRFDWYTPNVAQAYAEGGVMRSLSSCPRWRNCCRLTCASRRYATGAVGASFTPITA